MTYKEKQHWNNTIQWNKHTFQVSTSFFYIYIMYQ